MAATCSCGAPLGGNKKFCSRSCHARANRMSVLEWEQKIAQQMENDGWEIISPTACCDRIGIKDGKVFFLEFKPRGRTYLRRFQARVHGLVPEMYRIVVGDVRASIDAEETVVVPDIRERRRSARKRRGNASSKFKGVHWNADKELWRARLMVHGKRFSLGDFDSEEDAALAYDRAVIQHYGAEAFLNLPEKAGVLSPIPA